MHGVPENFLKVTDMTYYYPIALQQDVPVNKTDNGELDVVEMLYSNASINNYPGWPSNNTDYYNITLGPPNDRQIFTETIKIILPSGFMKYLSATAGDIIRLRNYDTNSDWTYRA